MTLEEAEWISRNRLPEEPREDELASWRATRPLPEPRGRQQRLDTMPTQPVDMAAVIRGALKGERVLLTEAFGGALAEYGDGLLDEIETMIAATAAELREEFARQIDQLRSEFSNRIDLVHTQGSEPRAQLEQVIARKRRAKAAKANGEHLLLPAPALADASLVPRTNGDGRS
jgi:hypothetical protein